MKDFSNYHNININEKISHDGLLLLERSLDGFEANDVLINNAINSKVLVYQKYDADSTIKKVIGRIEDIEQGNVLYIDGLNWLITSFPEDNKIYKKAEMQLCNSTYPIKANKTRVLIGNNPKTGEPIYDWQEGTPTNIPCIVETSFTNASDNSQLPLPQGQMIVTLQYKSDLGIKVNDEFVMYGNQYKISSLDQTKIINDKGILKIIAKEV